MARTKASVGAKVSSGKSSKARCSVAPPPSNSSSTGGSDRSSRSTSGGNSVCPRETPKWQRPITNFFITKETNGRVSDSEDAEIEVAAGSSKTKPKRNVIESDEEEFQPECPKNTELDESIELLPLTGEDSHKMEDYYPKNGEKGKGKGKKTKDKENIDGNTSRNSIKRDLGDVIFGEESGHASKRIKV